MGLIIGKFRKKKSTYDVLEKLENEITSIEEFSRSTEQYRKKIITRFILLAISIYFILGCILYLYYNRISPNQKLVYGVPFIAFPFIIWFIKKFLGWYYSRKLQRNEKKLIKLKEDKKKMLDNVMETETYKVAKKILDKFGTEKRHLVSEVPLTTNVMARNSQTALRQRQPYGQSSKTRLSIGSPKTPEIRNFGFDRPFPQPTPMSHLVRPGSALQTPRVGSLVPASPYVADTSLPLPRSILPSNRSALDKMVDYLVGDGPSNRYALICKKCSNHNGMALKEEFEYLSFRCCYCSHFNQARKKKPTGPKFEAQQTLKITEDDSSESEKDTADSEPEVRNLKGIIDSKSRSYSEMDIRQPLVLEGRRHSSSPEAEKSSDPEKNSDFDKLSDLDNRESGDGTVKLPRSADSTTKSPESGVCTVKSPYIDETKFDTPETGISTVKSPVGDRTVTSSETEDSTFKSQERGDNVEEVSTFMSDLEESPMEIDHNKSRTDLKENES